MAVRPVMPQGDANEQAIYWLALLTSGEEAEGQHRAFEQWLAEDMAHRAAWARAQSLWRDIERLTEQDLPTAPVQTRKPPLRRAGFSYAWAYAACLALALILGQDDLVCLFADYRTGTGGRQSVVLADGSEVQLNTGTALSVVYSASSRRVTLHSGEAWFNVAPDSNRSFEVVTEYGAVRALGTSFDVKTLADSAAVTVFQHAVRITLNSGKQAYRLPEGASLRFGKAVIAIDKQADIEVAAAWRRQRMIFKDRPLQEVISELNRYRKGRIVIADTRLNALPLTATFDTTDPEEALLMIRSGLKLNEYRITNRLVFLYPG